MGGGGVPVRVGINHKELALYGFYLANLESPVCKIHTERRFMETRETSGRWPGEQQHSQREK